MTDVNDIYFGHLHAQARVDAALRSEAKGRREADIPSLLESISIVEGRANVYRTNKRFDTERGDREDFDANRAYWENK